VACSIIDDHEMGGEGVRQGRRDGGVSSDHCCRSRRNMINTTLDGASAHTGRERSMCIAVVNLSRGTHIYTLLLFSFLHCLGLNFSLYEFMHECVSSIHV
jgi:hypothetical protein